MSSKPQTPALLPKRMSIGEEKPRTKAPPFRNGIILNYPDPVQTKISRYGALAILVLPATQPALTCIHIAQFKRRTTEATRRIANSFVRKRHAQSLAKKTYGKTKALKPQIRQPNPEPRVVGCSQHSARQFYRLRSTYGKRTGAPRCFSTNYDGVYPHHYHYRSHTASFAASPCWWGWT